MANYRYRSDSGWQRVRPGAILPSGLPESDTFTQPMADLGRGTYRGCLYIHGSGGGAGDITAPHTPGYGIDALIGPSLCGRFPTCAADMGGNNWGNDISIVAMKAMHDQLIARGAADAPMVLACGSMGGLPALRFTKYYPELVHCIVMTIPCLDIVDERTNVPATRADQDTAWGVTYPTPIPEFGTGEFDELPSNPFDFWEDIDCPILLCSASNDPIVSVAKQIAFCDQDPDKREFVNVGPYGHSALSVGLSVLQWNQWFVKQQITSIV